MGRKHTLRNAVIVTAIIALVIPVSVVSSYYLLSASNVSNVSGSQLVTDVLSFGGNYTTTFSPASTATLFCAGCTQGFVRTVVTAASSYSTVTHSVSLVQVQINVANSCGNPLSGVQLSLYNSNVGSFYGTTNLNGQYTFSVPQESVYAVSAVAAGYSWINSYPNGYFVTPTGPIPVQLKGIGGYCGPVSVTTSVTSSVASSSSTTSAIATTTATVISPPGVTPVSNFVIGPTFGPVANHVSSYNYNPTIMRGNDGLYRMWWCSYGTLWGSNGDNIWYAISRDGVQWVNAQDTFGVAQQYWSVQGVNSCDPAVLYLNGVYYLYYGANGIWLTTSTDGIHWNQAATQILGYTQKNPSQGWGFGAPRIIVTPTGTLRLYFASILSTMVPSNLPAVCGFPRGGTGGTEETFYVESNNPNSFPSIDQAIPTTIIADDGGIYYDSGSGLYIWSESSFPQANVDPYQTDQVNFQVSSDGQNWSCPNPSLRYGGPGPTANFPETTTNFVDLTRGPTGQFIPDGLFYYVSIPPGQTYTAYNFLIYVGALTPGFVDTQGNTQSSNVQPSGALRAVQITASASGIISAVGINIAVPAGDIEVALYSSYSNGQFTGLMGQSANTVAVSGWNDLQIISYPGPHTITAGQPYYVVFENDNSNLNVYYQLGGQGIYYYNNQPYGVFTDPSQLMIPSPSTTYNMRITYAIP